MLCDLTGFDSFSLLLSLSLLSYNLFLFLNLLKSDVQRDSDLSLNHMHRHFSLGEGRETQEPGEYKHRSSTDML